MKTTQEYSKECTVLFVDDEKDARELIGRILSRFFKDVYLAENGKDGIEKYKELKPDLIITDINMPDLNGLDMIAAIREDDIGQKIIILSAYNDHSFFETAINHKVDGYLIKPVNKEALLKAIDNSVRLVVQKRELENLNKHLEKRVEEEVEKNSKKDRELIATLTNFLETSPNPIAVYEKKVLRFANREFFELVNKKKEEILDKEFCIEDIFENRKGFISKLDEISGEIHKNKVSVSIEHKRSIFYIIKNSVPLLNKSLIMYTLNDITVSEYQKLKIEHYSQRLEDYIKRINRQRVTDDKKEKGGKPVSQEKEVKKRGAKAPEKAAKKEARELDEEEMNVLKKSHQGKEVSSKEYTEQLDSYVYEEIQELSEIENEIEDELLEFKDTKDIGHIYAISQRILKYSSTISLLFEFEDLSFAVRSLANLLSALKPESLDDTKAKKLDLFLTNIMLDLSSWRKTIFVNQNANDIHYLDSSLFSAILQLELEINEKAALDEADDDLELF